MATSSSNTTNIDDFYDPKLAKNVQLKCIVIGGGQRGKCYSVYARDFPHLLKVVAIADPKQVVRDYFKSRYNIPDELAFSDWRDLEKLDKFVDFVIICTPDKLHKNPAVSMANKGYHILLEKPMATTAEDCIAITEACERNSVMLCVCHVLRYFPPARKIKELIEGGKLGEVACIQHIEPVGSWHFAHSYVRGNWRNTAESSFSLLAKSCHDIDLLAYWMASPVVSISSFGSLHHFKKENKPEGSSDRCLDCKLKKTCPYSAVRIYQDRAKNGYFNWPISVVTDIEDFDVLTQKLRTGPYGRCVYDCDNDVCDNQVVNLQYKDGATASFTMAAFTKRVCQRTVKVFGSKGEVSFDGIGALNFTDFTTNTVETIQCDITNPSRLTGHSGADFFLMDSFVKAIMFNDPSKILSDARSTLHSHLLVFAAEKSRLSGQTLHQTNGDWHNI